MQDSQPKAGFSISGSNLTSAPQAPVRKGFAGGGVSALGGVKGEGVGTLGLLDIRPENDGIFDLHIKCAAIVQRCSENCSPECRRGPWVRDNLLYGFFLKKVPNKKAKPQ